MSRKSRRHGRHLSRSKRRKFRKGFYTPPQPSAVAQPYEPAPRAEVISPPAPAPRVKVALAQSVNVATELKRVGILAGIILVILIVLALVLR